MKVRVLACVEVIVEMPDDSDPQWLEFSIEEHSCPGTGLVGNAIDEAIEYGEQHGVCWACNLKGQNKIIEIIK